MTSAAESLAEALRLADQLAACSSEQNVRAFQVAAGHLVYLHGPALLAALRLREWRPIESAPKDGRQVVASMIKDDEAVVWWIGDVREVAEALAAPAEGGQCGCGLATCVEPWEPGCGLGNSEAHAIAQPAEGDGAVADALTAVNDAANDARHAGDYAKANALVKARVALYRASTRPSAAAAVDDAMVERACEARWPSWRNPNLRTDDARNEMRRILTTALAQQEPRHD